MKSIKLMTTVIAVVLGTCLSGCYDENVETVGVCPIVVSTSPSNLSDGIALDKVITVTFNVGMDPLTITPDVFTLTGVSNGRMGASAVSSEVSGLLSYDSTTNTMSFEPGEKPQPNTTYTGIVGTSAKDMDGTPLQTPYVWTFRTASTNSPIVVSTDPANDETNVVLNKKITATFNVPMDPLTITSESFSLMEGTTSLAGTVSGTGATASFTPATALLPNTLYKAIISGVKNLKGTALSNEYVWTFTTGTLIAPTVISTFPANLETGVPVHQIISATFSEEMDPSTINTSSFKVSMGNGPVSGEVTYSGQTATFTPTSNCFSCTHYTVVLTTAAKNIAGIPLANDYVWSFKTNY